MDFNKVLNQAKELATPSKSEEQKVRKTVSEITKKVGAQITKDKLDAKLIIGGSVGKGTWLPGLSDTDFFLAFDHDEFADRTLLISDFAEKVLKKVFKLQRLKGSRDYFSTNYKGLYVEIVPVLEIKKLKQAKNITDFSPLHVDWVRQRIRKNPKLQADIRLAKQFFKAAGVYGAESYVRGLSGHVIEILTIYYGGFLPLLKGIARWKERDVIDLQKYYGSSKEVFATLNPSKTISPIIVIDPIEPERNAAAALDREKFLLAKKVCTQFLAKPNLEFFKEKKVSVAELEKKKDNLKLIVIEAKPKKGKPDVVGAALLKKFEALNISLAEHDFVTQDSGWWWPEHGAALYWFYFDRKPLPTTKEHSGPPVKMEKFAKQFRKKWKNVKAKNGRLVAQVKRKFTKPEDLLRTMVKTDKSLKILKVIS